MGRNQLHYQDLCQIEQLAYFEEGAIPETPPLRTRGGIEVKILRIGPLLIKVHQIQVRDKKKVRQTSFYK